jgi:phospholipid/cholesterol/gamma-HCH transport system ATP-binding protein
VISVSLPSTIPGNPAAPETQHIAVVFDDVGLAFDDVVILDGVSFQLRRGETKAIFGIAGTGKTLMLKMALGLTKPDRGHIYVLGHDVTQMKEEELFELRRKVGMVFQESALFDSMSVRDNVAFRLIEEGQTPPEEIDQRVREVLRFVELERTIDMLPSELSGGMRRRVSIARAIITQPEVILYDSPTGGLDPITSTTIVELIVKQRDVYRTSSLLVTHRLQDAFTMATSYFDTQANQMQPIAPGMNIDVNTSFLILRDGKIIFDGDAPELAHTRDEYIKEYIA